MSTLATIGALIEVSPWDDLQHWPDSSTDWQFLKDRTPFCFRVAGELINDGFFFGLYGPVESGLGIYRSLVCSIMLRIDNPDWHNSAKCSAGFKVGPNVAKRKQDYASAENYDFPFYLHPEGTHLEGFPRISRFGGVRVVPET